MYDPSVPTRDGSGAVIIYIYHLSVLTVNHHVYMGTIISGDSCHVNTALPSLKLKHTDSSDQGANDAPARGLQLHLF